MGMPAFYWINGQLYLNVRPPFLLVFNTVKVQFVFKPKSAALLFNTAVTIFLDYKAFLIKLKI